jgi:hypothetical protein
MLNCNEISLNNHLQICISMSFYTFIYRCQHQPSAKGACVRRKHTCPCTHRASVRPYGGRVPIAPCACGNAAKSVGANESTRNCAGYDVPFERACARACVSVCAHVCVCLCVCARARVEVPVERACTNVRACVRACVCACVRAIGAEHRLCAFALRLLCFALNLGPVRRVPARACHTAYSPSTPQVLRGGTARVLHGYSKGYCAGTPQGTPKGTARVLRRVLRGYCAGTHRGTARGYSAGNIGTISLTDHRHAVFVFLSLERYFLL